MQVDGLEVEKIVAIFIRESFFFITCTLEMCGYVSRVSWVRVCVCELNL